MDKWLIVSYIDICHLANYNMINKEFRHVTIE